MLLLNGGCRCVERETAADLDFFVLFNVLLLLGDTEIWVGVVIKLCDNRRT